jgi:cytochrome c oxidase subunit I+III
VPSPPPPYSFREIPVTPGRHPLWDWRAGAARQVVPGMRTGRREVVVTSLPNAVAQHLYPVPGPSVYPLVLALALWAGLLAFVLTGPPAG